MKFSTPLSRETPLKSPLNVKEDRLSTPFSWEARQELPWVIVGNNYRLSTPLSWEAVPYYPVFRCFGRFRHTCFSG